ncbi:MAG: hypothetical protein N2C14_04635 [Planctomycetales bacterium]
MITTEDQVRCHSEDSSLDIGFDAIRLEARADAVEEDASLDKRNPWRRQIEDCRDRVELLGTSTIFRLAAVAGWCLSLAMMVAYWCLLPVKVVGVLVVRSLVLRG